MPFSLQVCWFLLYFIRVFTVFRPTGKPCHVKSGGTRFGNPLKLKQISIFACLLTLELMTAQSASAANPLTISAQAKPGTVTAEFDLSKDDENIPAPPAAA